jgi:intergrase/recombinase
MICQEIERQESADKFVGKVVLFSGIRIKHICFVYTMFPCIWSNQMCLGSNVRVFTVFKNLNIVYMQ